MSDAFGTYRHRASFVALSFAALLASLALLAAPAAAKEVRPSLGAFGSAEQPSFAEPLGLAVDQGSHDVYVIDGRTEQQKITVSATAGKFKLRFGGKEGELKFDASEEEVQSKLREIICGGGDCVSVFGGGSKPYGVDFRGTLWSTAVPQIECESGSPPLSGGSGCTVETTVDGVNGSLRRYHADGTPADFSALGSDAIDGRGAGDGTPQSGLNFVPAEPDASQVAVDNSCALHEPPLSGAECEAFDPADGDIYLTQFNSHVVDVFAPSGEYLGQLSEFKEGAVFKPLATPVGVAIDPSGDVYLGDFSPADLIHKYDPTAEPVANADNVANFNSLLGESSPTLVAAGAGPTAGSLFVKRLDGKLFKLDAASGAVRYRISDAPPDPVTELNDTRFTTLTVDPTSGRLFATAGHFSSTIKEYDASGESTFTLLHTIAAKSALSGVAVDGSTGKGGTLYLSRAGASHLEAFGPLAIVPDVTTGAASGIGPGSATLQGTISADNGPSAGCHFQYLADAAYLANVKAAEQASKTEPKTPEEIAEAAFAGAQSAPCEPSGPFTGSGVNAVSAKAEGLAHETAYRFRIVGESSNGSSAGEFKNDPQNPSCPPVLSTCPLLFETFGKPQIKGSGVSEIAATAAKVSAEVNPAGQATGYAVQYVTEADFLKSGFNNATSVPSPAKAIGSGSVFTQVSEQLAELEPATAYRFRLAATNVDGTTLGKEGAFATFAPPEGLPDERAYEMVTPPLKLGEVFPPEPGPRPGLGGSCSGCVPGFSKEKMPMQSSPDGDAVAYEGFPLSAGLAAGANEYVGKRGAGGWGTTALSKPQFPDSDEQGFKAFSADLSRTILYQIEPSLGAEAPPDYANLYLGPSGGELKPLLTSAPPNRSSGVIDENSNPNALALTYAGANAGDEAVAPFGHVVFQANDALTNEVAGIAPKAPPVGAKETDLYEWSGGQLRLVNVLPGNAAAAPNATFGSGRLVVESNFDFDHAISDDGARVFWSQQPSGQVYVREGGTTTTKVPDPGKFLTASADGSKVLLDDGKVYDLEGKALTDLTAGQGGFEGTMGAAEDLSRVYFVDNKVLSGEVNANGEAAEEGKPNLYLWEEGAVPHEGTTSFIARQLGADSPLKQVFGMSAWNAAPGNRLAQVSADGRFLAFESRAQPTGYDNALAGGGNCPGSTNEAPGCFEVFEYDAQSATLACPSCNPSGQRPLGPSNLALIFGKGFRQPHNLAPAGQGRLFFESQDALSLADANGHIQDVYEWEPGGVGSCERAGGCLSLISSGTSPRDSHFIDAGATGKDVFFDARDQLAPQDKDDLLDLYDARVGGGIESSPLEPCLGEACKGPATAAPSDPSAASATFAGPGNEAQPRCAPKKVLRRGRCVKRPRHHRRARHHRGGSR